MRLFGNTMSSMQASENYTPMLFEYHITSSKMNLIHFLFSMVPLTFESLHKSIIKEVWGDRECAFLEVQYANAKNIM